MDWNRDGGLIVLFFVLFLSAILLAAAETSLVRVSRVRIATRADDGSKRARRALRLLDDLTHVLNAILLSVLLVQIGAATVTGVLAARWFGNAGVTIASLVLTFVLFVYSEAIPKTFAYRHPARVVMALSYPVAWLAMLLRPLVVVLVKFADLQIPGHGVATTPTVTERELRSLAASAASEGEITKADLNLIEGAFRLGDRTAEEVMVPRVDVVGVPAATTASQALQRALGSGHRRLLVVGRDIDDVVGVVRQRDLAGQPTAAVADLAFAPIVVAETKRVIDLLREMQREGIHVAVVVDEHGGTSGIVTIEDIVEELFGVIGDEGLSALPGLHRLADGGWSIPGRTLISDLTETLGLELPTGDWTTIAGLVMGLAGELPRPGTAIRAGECHVRVTSLTGRRINRVEVRVVSPS
jgi:putative hemolysin